MYVPFFCEILSYVISHFGRKYNSIQNYYNKIKLKIKIRSSKNSISVHTPSNFGHQNHSITVGKNLKYSTTVDSSSYEIIVTADETPGTIRTFGKFQSYPDGIFNPAFCGMLLWELVQGHISNEYKIIQFHQIRSGIIMYGCEAYVSTPISNNDIHSHLKILPRKKTFKHILTPIKAS